MKHTTTSGLKVVLAVVCLSAWASANEPQQGMELREELLDIKTNIIKGLGGGIDERQIWQINVVDTDAFYVVTKPQLIRGSLCKVLKFFGMFSGTEVSISNPSYDSKFRSGYHFLPNGGSRENCLEIGFDEYFLVESPIEEGTLIELIQFVRIWSQQRKRDAKDACHDCAQEDFKIHGIQIGPTASAYARHYLVSVLSGPTGSRLILEIERTKGAYEFVNISKLHQE